LPPLKIQAEDDQI